MKLLNVAWHTLKNCTRQPFYLISFLFTAISATALPILSQFSLYDQQRMLMDSLFGLILTTGILLTVLISEYSIGNDFCNGRALLLFSKPIGIVNYSFGKLIGNSIAMLIFLLFSAFVIINMQSVVTQNFFFDFYKFASFIASILLGFMMGTLVNYFFKKNFSVSTLTFTFVFLFINTIFWINKSTEPERISNLFRQGRIYALLSLFIVFIGASTFPISVKFKSGGILAYIICVLSVGLLTPHLFPSINDYWLIDLYYSSQEISDELILKSVLTISIYSLFFTTILYARLKHAQLAKIS